MIARSQNKTPKHRTTDNKTEGAGDGPGRVLAVFAVDRSTLKYVRSLVKGRVFKPGTLER